MYSMLTVYGFSILFTVYYIGHWFLFSIAGVYTQCFVSIELILSMFELRRDHKVSYKYRIWALFDAFAWHQSRRLWVASIRQYLWMLSIERTWETFGWHPYHFGSNFALIWRCLYHVYSVVFWIGITLQRSWNRIRESRWDIGAIA